MAARSELLFSPTASWRQIAAATGHGVMEASGLSPAEQAVARCLQSGLTNREIATALGKAERTVKNQVSAIFLKTGVRTRARFIAAGIQ
jgi:DNA-binding NarL/FixJ family response regulator